MKMTLEPRKQRSGAHTRSGADGNAAIPLQRGAAHMISAGKHVDLLSSQINFQMSGFISEATSKSPSKAKSVMCFEPKRSDAFVDFA